MPFEVNYLAQEPTQEDLLNQAGDILLEFGADWCPHCQAILPFLQSSFREDDDIKHLKVADGKGKRLGRLFGVKLWPTLVFIRDGNILKQMARPSAAEIAEGFELFSKS